MELDAEGWPVVSAETDVESVEVEKPGRRANSGSFKKGDSRQGKRRPRTPVEGTGLIRAFRHCLANPAYLDKTPDEKMARKIMEKNPDKFMARLEDLERQEMMDTKGDVTVPDLGHDAAMRIIDRLLTEASS